jgi:hypothetical protein
MIWYRGIPAEILVYKPNTAPLFRERFCSTSTCSRDPHPIAKGFFRQSVRICCGIGRFAEMLREIGARRGAAAAGRVAPCGEAHDIGPR